MALETIKCTDFPEGKEGPKVAIEFNFDCGGNLEHATDLYGHEAVYKVFVGAMRLRAQKAAKVISRAGGDIQEFMSTWVPSTQMPRAPRIPRDTVGDFMAIFTNSSPERQAELKALMNKDLAQRTGADAQSTGVGRKK